MGKVGYYLAVSVVIALILAWGLMAHPFDPDYQQGPRVNRGPAPAAGLARNFDLQEIDRVQRERGDYPPRALGLTAQRRPPSDSWLLDADSDSERFRRIEVAMRGLDIHMAEIGVRFDVMHDAIERGNLRLASLEAEKSIETARIAMLKRPGLTGDQGLKYMGAPQWTELMAALESGDQARSRAAFAEVRQTCMSCHAARGMGFINDSRLFDSTANFAGGSGTAAAAPAAPAANSR